MYWDQLHLQRQSILNLLLDPGPYLQNASQVVSAEQVAGICQITIKQENFCTLYYNIRHHFSRTHTCALYRLRSIYIDTRAHHHCFHQLGLKACRYNVVPSDASVTRFGCTASPFWALSTCSKRRIARPILWIPLRNLPAERDRDGLDVSLLPRLPGSLRCSSASGSGKWIFVQVSIFSGRVNCGGSVLNETGIMRLRTKPVKYVRAVSSWPI